MNTQMSKARAPKKRRFNFAPKHRGNLWGDLVASINRFTPDFMAERDPLNKKTVARRS
jgi:hypothetical protein